jgi:hypothetical protein
MQTFNNQNQLNNLQESQQTPGVFQVTAFSQFPHGYLHDNCLIDFGC